MNPQDEGRNRARDLVLVTGGSGFIGSAICRLLLQQGYDVRILIRPTSPRTNICCGVEIVEGDIMDRLAVRRALAGVRFLFHVAAIYRLWTPEPRELTRVNVEGAELVMREALRAGIERIVYTSSVTTLTPNRSGPCDETRRYPLDQAKGAYKRSKILCERLIDSMIESEGLPAVIVNPSAPLGPGDLRPTPTGRIVLEALRGRIPAFVDTGLNIAHVDDVAMGHLHALERGRIGEHYILGGENMSLAAILEEIARLTGRAPPRIQLPRLPLIPVAAFNELLARLSGEEPLLSIESLRQSETPMYFDDAKARRELGYVSRPHRQAIIDAVTWFRNWPTFEGPEGPRLRPEAGKASSNG
jgi:dihydroflavonol-4-reductase